MQMVRQYYLQDEVFTYEEYSNIKIAHWFFMLLFFHIIFYFGFDCFFSASRVHFWHLLVSRAILW